MNKFLLTIDSQSIAVQIANMLNTGNQLYTHIHPRGISNNGIQYIIELDIDKVIGVIGLEQQGHRVTEMKHLCVHPSYRCKGLGRKLLEKGIKVPKTEFVYGAVRNDNYTNMRNNLRIGMIPIGKKIGSRGCHIIIFARRSNCEYRIFGR